LEAKIDNFSSWMTYSSNHQLKTDVEGLIIGSGFTVLKFIDHAFDPQGYTALWLLAESHCALHTFPEEQKAYLEISSCNSEMYVNFVVAYHQYIKDGKN
tara:strand:+ start:226 stop:522 length:297 start_codon:yes stop_codon:yes gene_type:complete